MTGDRFINPYTFVPLPETIDRRAPVGHDRLYGDRYSGTLEVRLTARSRLMVRGWGTAEVPQVPTRPTADGGREAMIPGSSLHGALRSHHEALAGGCLRVLSDQDMLPFYRDVVVPGVGKGRRLAVVAAVDGNGRPTEFRTCDTVVRVGHVALAERLRALGDGVEAGAVTTGRTFSWRRPPAGKGVRARKTKDLDRLKPDSRGDWVLLVRPLLGDAGEQDLTKYTHTLGHLDGRTVAGVSDTAWDTYRGAVKGTEDWRTACRDGALTRDESAVPVPVVAGDRVIAVRHADRPWLHPGQVLWIDESTDDTGRTTGLALAVAWRHRGAGPLSERIGEFWPCWDDQALCPSCRVFGSVDALGSDEAAQQRGYRGHVRVSDAVVVGTPEVAVVELAPLMAPRPGAGQFYLVNQPGQRPTKGRPAKEWGSAADQPKTRPIRGRKFYWRTAPRTDHHDRARRRDGHTDDTTSAAAVFEAGSEFTFCVHFENLSDAELGGLVVAIQPHRLWPEGPADGVVAQGISVGGGKPFGFGFCTAEVTLARLDTAASRYLDDPPPVGGDAFLSRAVEAFRSVAAGRMRAPWAAARVVLRPLDQARSDLVWYPPGAGWDQVGSPEFDRGFDFWKRSQGLHGEKTVDPFVPLPLPTDADLSLPIQPQAPRPTAARNSGDRGNGMATTTGRDGKGGRGRRNSNAKGK